MATAKVRAAGTGGGAAKAETGGPAPAAAEPRWGTADRQWLHDHPANQLLRRYMQLHTLAARAGEALLGQLDVLAADPAEGCVIRDADQLRIDLIVGTDASRLAADRAAEQYNVGPRELRAAALEGADIHPWRGQTDEEVLQSLSGQPDPAA